MNQGAVPQSGILEFGLGVSALLSSLRLLKTWTFSPPNIICLKDS